jgi:alpha-tubulin suppressor-like RCC1 family protein
VRLFASILLLVLTGCEPAITIGSVRTDASDSAMDASDSTMEASDSAMDASDSAVDAPDADPPSDPDPAPDASVPCANVFTATHIAVGEAHTCAIHDQFVYCWGHGLSGQLGNGNTEPQYSPKPITLFANFQDVTAMTLGTCARRSDSPFMLMCWGENFAGGLADGTEDASAFPIDTITGTTVIAGGHSNMLTRNAAGLVTVWGDNTYGQLGLDPMVTGAKIKVETPIPGSSFRLLTGGAHHACVTNPSGHVYCSGENANRQLGIAGGTRTSFTLVTNLLSFANIDAGANRTCGVISTTGELYCWGQNVPTIVPGEGTELAIPTRVGTESGYSQVSVGFGVICALRNAGHLYCWGTGAGGALGLSDDLDRDVPTEITPGVTYKYVSVGRYYACAIRRSDLAVVCFGRNDDAQLARPEGDTSTMPQAVCK